MLGTMDHFAVQAWERPGVPRHVTERAFFEGPSLPPIEGPVAPRATMIPIIEMGVGMPWGSAAQSPDFMSKKGQVGGRTAKPPLERGLNSVSGRDRGRGAGLDRYSPLSHVRSNVQPTRRVSPSGIYVRRSKSHR